ncbi:MAG: ABC transporter permease [Thermoplasmata archaeon]|nr:ABC transporter permease [Candidatus Sysuiplasma acidicola]MBX8637459.1 ABC transporter permease [Candidatus Sysuiplasma acidicola]MBX8646699.1 ABC transporter permease [Candidatus Sysuiplasma acidicola]MDH2905623.1 ABC transporter permease [Methanomassiliicoccales archaeon]
MFSSIDTTAVPGIESSLSQTLRLLIRNRSAITALSIIGFFVFLALFGPYFTPFNPDALNLALRLSPPSSTHIMGTDEYGRDVFSRILYAARLDMAIALLSTTLSYLLGVTIGVVSGFLGKITDSVMMRFMDILLSFPSILFAIAIAISIGPGFNTIIIAIVVVTIPGFARIARSSVLSTKEELYVLAAASVGASRWHIMYRHIVPNVISPTLVFYSLGLGNSILIAASLSFLGVGIPPPTPEWGAMISSGLQYVVSGQWWLTVFPGLFIVAIVVAFNLLGDTIREVSDVTLRR